MNLMHRTTRRVATTAAMLIAGLVVSVGLPASASAAVSEYRTVTVNSNFWIVDNSVEIWNWNGTRVWRSEGKQVSGGRPFTYTYTYRGGNEYLRIQVRSKGVNAPSRDMNHLNIRCNHMVQVNEHSVDLYADKCP